MEFVLDPKQAEAVALGCDIKKRMVAITGAAGAGKTTIMRLIYEKLIEHGYKVALCAPTGKAAKRIKEATGINACTAHRLLEYSHPGDRHPVTGKVLGYSQPMRDQFNRLEFDVVLCDEYMMVNTELHRNLLDALPRNGCLRMFGDVNQLAPIEEGGFDSKEPAPFQLMLAKMPNVTLDVNHRQNEGSGIVENGWFINKGRMPKRNKDFDISITDEPVKLLRRLLLERAAAGELYTGLTNQIISTSRVRWTGSLALNAMIQQMFMDDSKPFMDVPRHKWEEAKDIVCRVQVGNKVICTQNLHDLELYNGETGLVTELTEYGEIAIDFGDREVVVPPMVEYVDKHGITKSFDPRMDIELAYAITTHKAQGSEYDNVIYILNSSTIFMQNRRNTYTAATRARNHVHMICDQRSLTSCVMIERRR